MYRTQDPAPAANRPLAGLPDLPAIEHAARVVYREFQATPQYRWGLSSQRLGSDCWIKHENHTPVGAFKIRGGLTYFDALRQADTLPNEVISATRGNHGQSIGWAARAHGVACTIVVPRGNSLEKNAAMRALGVTLIEHGEDFQESREHAMALAAERGAHMVPSFHAHLLSGVSTYWWEFREVRPPKRPPGASDRSGTSWLVDHGLCQPCVSRPTSYVRSRHRAVGGYDGVRSSSKGVVMKRFRTATFVCLLGFVLSGCGNALKTMVAHTTIDNRTVHGRYRKCRGQHLFGRESSQQRASIRILHDRRANAGLGRVR